MVEQSAYDKGADACTDGQTLDDNPYEIGTEEWSSWNMGWNEAADDADTEGDDEEDED